MTNVRSSNLGYPRIGEQREWKRALEKYWSGETTQEELLKETKKIRLQGLKKQQSKGIDLIPVGDFTLYDHVLDTAIMFGVVPKRFQNRKGDTPIDTYFEIARGSEHAIASEMTKWFNTNYHYIVPEFNDVQPILAENRILRDYKEAKEELGIDGKPVILGPTTFLKLGKGYKESEFPELLDRFVPLYIQVLKELHAEGVTWVQVDEPIFGTELKIVELQLVKEAYEKIASAVPGIKLLIQTYFETVENFPAISTLPVAGLGLDFVHGESLQLLQTFGFPQDKVLAAGIIDGRNVWRQDLDESFTLLESIQQFVSKDRLIVQPSCSLLHVPVTKISETELDSTIKDALSFADEKLDEIVAIKEGLQSGIESVVVERTEAKKAIESLNQSKYRSTSAIDGETAAIVDRDLPFNERIAIQKNWLNLPLLPTTTIGSLPQTAEVRKQRLKWRKGELSQKEYELYIEAEIKKWIEIQEQIGLDVLVHGEFERTDMVEYFGEKLNGFQVTKYAWVQSYGSRCVKPPLIVGTVSFDKPMTVKESVFAQSLTEKRVKGMLTGPVTILNWSFVRDDISRYEVLNEIAVALRSEIEELEKEGIHIIQVDEPALREGLPIRRSKWAQYLEAAVHAFKLSTATVENSTQIHTHMCYSNFEDIYEAISALDADVISIETSRSHGELISTFEQHTYDKEIGLGVYDIHSPRVPSVEEIKGNINRALQTIPAQQFWINPDCGLKTRQEPETIAALERMVKAAQEVRSEQLATAQKQ